MRIKKPWAMAAALLGAAGLTLALPILPAVGQSSPPGGPIKLGAKATIVDRGAAVLASVRVVCPPGDSLFVSVFLSERSGNGIASGSGSPNGPVTCTGGSQTVKIPVPAANNPFVVGTAFGEAQMNACDFFGCTFGSDQGNVAIVKASKKK